MHGVAGELPLLRRYLFLPSLQSPCETEVPLSFFLVRHEKETSVHNHGGLSFYQPRSGFWQVNIQNIKRHVRFEIANWLTSVDCQSPRTCHCKFLCQKDIQKKVWSVQLRKELALEEQKPRIYYWFWSHDLIRLRVIHFSHYLSCVTRKKTARKKMAAWNVKYAQSLHIVVNSGHVAQLFSLCKPNNA